eukprot:87183-Rhodomonas_salina.1
MQGLTPSSDAFWGFQKVKEKLRAVLRASMTTHDCIQRPNIREGVVAEGHRDAPAPGSRGAGIFSIAVGMSPHSSI